MAWRAPKIFVGHLTGIMSLFSYCIVLIIELPPITMPNLNGDGVGHIAKDDLLGDSDSSVSHTEKDKTADDSEDEK